MSEAQETPLATAVPAGRSPAAVGPRPDSTLDSNPPADDEARSKALDRFFKSYYRFHPVNATYTGAHDYDHLLPDWSPEGLSDHRREMGDLRRALASVGLGVLDRESLVNRDWIAIDGALADAGLEIELAELGSPHFHRGNLSLAIGEAVFGVMAHMTRPYAGIETRGTNAVARLRAFPLFLVGVRRVIEDNAMPEAWRERVLRECEGGRVLLDQVEPWLEAEGATAAVRSDASVGLAVARESLSWFSSFVASHPAAPDSRYAAGSPLLELLLRRGHWVDASLESLRWEAHETLEEEYQRLYVGIRRSGARNWEEVQAQLVQQRPAPEHLADALAQTWEACRALAGQRDLVTWPAMPIRYQPVPRWTRDAAPFLYYLLYRSPAPLDHEGVVDYAIPAAGDFADERARQNLWRLWNASAIKLNHVAHHGAIGHQLQNWHARRAPSRIGQVAAVDCASRIGMFLGGTMAEGWACYATELMEEAGFLTPLEQLAQQHTRVRLLTRAVIDLELHGGRMSFDDAVVAYVHRSGMTPRAARAEVVKNSMFPGTAIMYWLGTRDIKRLRTDRQRRAGSAFSPRRFHDELLSFGSIPVALAARILDAERGPRDA